MKESDQVPGWLAFLADRSVVFWRIFLAMAAIGLIGLSIFIHSRLQHIEESLAYRAPPGDGHVEAVGMPDVIAKGQTLFVPTYSHVYHQDGKPFLLAATLSVHNTDEIEPIVITSVDYHGTDGKLLRSYIDQPKQISALGSVEFLVAEKDVSGGSGAKFIVRWVAEKQVHAPVVQTVMVGTAGGQGLSFLCNAVVLEEIDE